MLQDIYITKFHDIIQYIYIYIYIYKNEISIFIQINVYMLVFSFIFKVMMTPVAKIPYLLECKMSIFPLNLVLKYVSLS